MPIIEVENLISKRRLTVSARVAPAAVFLSVPERVAVQLGFDLSEVPRREVALPNGHLEAVPMIGPVRVRFADRYCDLSALVLGDSPLIGAVPMAMMDLVLHRETQLLIVNPANRNVPVTWAK